jgi:hypothetical protein
MRAVQTEDAVVLFAPVLSELPGMLDFIARAVAEDLSAVRAG